VVEDKRTGERSAVPVRALFVFVGSDPHTRWLGQELALDERGFILTGPSAASAAGDGYGQLQRQLVLLETSRPGVLAAGDVRSGSIKRVASAVGEGSIAIRQVYEHLHQIAGPGPHPGDSGQPPAPLSVSSSSSGR
jgi:thioredoxin reductase (NADPH)